MTISGACSGSTSPVSSTTPFDPGAPLAVFATSHFAGSGNCAQCHSNLKDSTGADVSISSQWSSTMMANAAKDPYFMAETASLVNDLPSLDATIESTCAVCHMPMASTQAKADGTTPSILNNGFTNTSNPLNKAAMDGNSCSLCHQISGTNLGQPSSFTGGYQIDTSTKPPNRIEYGPFVNPLQSPMQSTVGFTPTQGAQVGNSTLCATCHAVYTPVVTTQGAVAGSFPEQVTYLEWQASVYGSNPAAQLACQSCHMPAASGSVAISNNPTTLTPRSPFLQHDFVGGNSFILTLMSNNVSSLGLTASSTAMQATAQLTADQLNSRTAQISVVSSEITDGKLSVTLAVIDQTGHKFPTGFPSRRAWIEFTVTDSSGKVVFQSGKPNADGSISGNAADTNSKSYEPNYDIITSSNQVEIYEAIMHDSSGNVTYNLLNAAGYLKDNRLLPSGFNKTTASADTAVVGSAATDPNFAGGSDQVTYQVTLGGKGPYTVSARLLYQSVAYQFSGNFQGTSPFISSFMGAFKSADKTPTQVASVSKTVG
jgi:mono/diheme cytochrome c family protein